MGGEINSINLNSLFQSLVILWRTPGHLWGGGEDDINKFCDLYFNFLQFYKIYLYGCIVLVTSRAKK